MAVHMSRRIKQFAVVSLIVGVFALRAALSNPPAGVLHGGCLSESEPVTWTRGLTLDFYQQCSMTYAEHAVVIYQTMVVCGAIMTLYGAVILFRHGLPGMNR
ncbi:hypothetical protein [Halobaculum sp. MBLA0143]|uniref:hypothetical protein n=1 Tax=Halobaculum sp. MBLA0143 TaxID=3079933 RepID=UPI003524CB6A